MKRIAFIIAVLCYALSMSSQSVLSFGVRGGFDFLLLKSEQPAHAQPGLGGNFDVGYTYYWPAGNSDLGIHTGASVGYANNKARVDFKQQYTNYDYMGNEMLYTTTGSVDVGIKRAHLEIPVMAALRHNGLIAQLGVKAQYAFWSQSYQRLANPIIDAYYVPFDVHVTNEVITGVVPAADLAEKTQGGGAPAFNILAALRIGYETRVGNQTRIGIMAYVDYNVWNTLSISRINQPLIAVSPITDAADPVPNVTINNAFASFISGINPLQVGVSLYFGIEFEQQYNSSYRRPKGYRSYSRRYR